MADHLEYTRGLIAGVEFTRASLFPQFEERQPLPDGPVTRAWLDGFAEAILSSRGDDAVAAEVKGFCRRFREAGDGEPAAA